MKYLVDTSALVRIWRRQVNPVWHNFARRGLISVCEPVIAESMLVADAKRYTATEEELRDIFLVAMIPDSIWDLTAMIRRKLATHSAHQGLSVTDLVVAATAMRLRLEVLHEDADFETAARFLPQLKQRRISAVQV